MQGITVQRICIALVALAGFVLAPLVASEMLDGNPIPFVSFLALGVLLWVIFQLRDRCWLLIPFSMPIVGTFNFLPLNFSMQETAVILVLGYFLFQIAMGRNIPIRFGGLFAWVPLLGVLAVFLYHWIASGDIGIRLLGGTGWGGRKYFSTLLAILSMPLIASLSVASRKDFQLVPLLYFLGAFIDLVPDTLTTLVPQLAPYIFKIYSSVNINEFRKEVAGNFMAIEGITRFGSFAKLGSALALVVLCYFPFSTWLQPARLWVLPLLGLSFFASAFSGFRSAVFNLAVVCLAGLFATARSKVLVLAPVAFLAVALVLVTQGTVFHYPKSLQRSLSFLPGQWDVVAEKEAEGSSKWRQRIRELFFAEYFHKAPWLGTGYKMDPLLAKEETDIYFFRLAQSRPDPYKDVRNFIEGKQPHEGDISALLVSGIVGTTFFILFCLTLIFYSLRVVLSRLPREIQPVQIWSFALLVQIPLSFFVVFGDLGPALMQLCPVAAILMASERWRRESSVSSLAPPSPDSPYPTPPRPEPVLARG